MSAPTCSLARSTTTTAPSRTQLSGSIVERDWPTTARAVRFCREFVGLGLDRVDDLRAEAPVERIEIGTPQRLDLWVGDLRQLPPSEPVVLEHARNFEHRELTVAPACRVGGDHPLIGVHEQQQRHPKNQLHPRPPEVVELVLEHAQGI